MPNLASLTEKLALSAAMAMSHAHASPTPPPSAAPCTRATVGFGQASMRASIPANLRASATFHSTVAVLARCIHCRSAPALKCLPSPASTITRTRSSAASWVKAASSSAIICSSKALNTAGRAIVTWATPGRGRLSTRVEGGFRLGSDMDRGLSWCPALSTDRSDNQCGICRIASRSMDWRLSRFPGAAAPAP